MKIRRTKRGRGRTLVATMVVALVSCAPDSASRSSEAPAAAESPAAVEASSPSAPVLVDRADVTIGAPTVLWFWAPG